METEKTAPLPALPEPLCLLTADGNTGNWTESGNDTGTPVFTADQMHAYARAAIAAQPAPDALKDMEARKDAAYLERNQVVAALAKAYPSGVARTAIEGWSADWHGCVYIDLPTGQASWHFHDSQAYLFADLPPYTGKWDGHDTPEKYRRLAALPAAHAQQPARVALTDADLERISSRPECWTGPGLGASFRAVAYARAVLAAAGIPAPTTGEG